MRIFTLIVMLVVAAAPSVPASESNWPRPPKGWLQYTDSSGVWRVTGGEDLTPYIQNCERNPAAGFWPGYRIMAEDPGDWYVFQVGMRSGYGLLLSEKSTVTLFDKKGSMIATGNMRLLRDPGQFEAVADLRRAPLVVRSGAFRGGSVGPSVAVRFPWGTVAWSHVKSFSVANVRVVHVEGGG